jgi:hypothetical protein
VEAEDIFVAALVYHTCHLESFERIRKQQKRRGGSRAKISGPLTPGPSQATGRARPEPTRLHTRAGRDKSLLPIISLLQVPIDITASQGQELVRAPSCHRPLVGEMPSDSYNFKPGGSLKFKGGDTVSGKSKK